MTREAMDPSSQMGPCMRSLLLDLACCSGDCRFPVSAFCNQCNKPFCQTCAPPRVTRGMCQSCLERDQTTAPAASSSSSHDDVDHMATHFMQTDASIEPNKCGSAGSKPETCHACGGRTLVDCARCSAPYCRACFSGLWGLCQPCLQYMSYDPQAADASHHSAGGSNHQAAGATSSQTACDATHQAAGEPIITNNNAAASVIVRGRIMCETCEHMFPEDEVWEIDGEDFCMRCLEQQQHAMDGSDTTWLMQRGIKRHIEAADADVPMDHSASASGSRASEEATSGYSPQPSNWAKAIQKEWEAEGATGCFVCCECFGVHPLKMEEGPSQVDLNGRPIRCNKCGAGVCASCSGSHECYPPQSSGAASSEALGNSGPCPAQRVRLGPNGEVLTPRGNRVHDTNDHNIPPTFASHDSWRFKHDTDDMGMLSTTYAMHPPVTAEVHSLSYVDCS